MQRELVFKAVSVGLGVWTALALHSGLNTKVFVFSTRQPPAPVKVAVRVASEAPKQPLSIKAAALPLAVQAPTERALSEAKGAETVSASDLPTLAQPKDLRQEKASTSALPRIDRPDAPPGPDSPVAPETSQYSDRAGHDVVVVALLVNDQGVVVDSKFLVPSRNPLSDLTLLYASRGQKWSGLVPPLLPGEQRWIEHRVDHSLALKPTSLIP